MNLTPTVFISDYSPSSNYSVFGYGFSGLDGFWLGFIKIVWDNDATF